MKKRLMSALLCLCMVICMMPTISLAAETASGTCGDNVTWSLSDDGTLTISGTGAMQDYTSSSSVPWYSNRSNIKTIVIESGVTSIANNSFSYCSNLESVTIPDGVTSIGDSAFSNCRKLTGMTIPNGVTSIGSYAFYYCEKLSSVKIPSGVTSIANNSFSYCSNLESVTIPNSVTSIANNSFSHCSNLESVTIPNSVTSIGENAFTYCTSLTSIEIPDSVTSIGERAFSNCRKLSSVKIPSGVTSIEKYTFYFCFELANVEIPDSVTSIGYRAFGDCRKLTSVKIPDSVTSIEEAVFQDCIRLTNIAVGEQNKNYSSEDGVLFNKNKTELLSYPINRAGESYSIPDGVTSIGSYAFFSSSKLTSVTIPNGVTSISDGIFYSCSNLSSVTIPNSVTSIENSAFYGCSKLPSITLPNSVTSIGEYAFNSCKKLTSITIPDSVTSIGRYVLYGSNYYNQESNWKDGILYCGNWVIDTKKEITTANIAKNTIGIANGAFSSSQLTSVTIPDNVRNIGNDAFAYCSSLNSVTIPNGVTSIGASAFYSCSKLTNLTIPGSVVEIGSNAFGIYYNTGAYRPRTDFIANVSEGSVAQEYCEKYKVKFENEHKEEAVAAKEATCTEDGHTAGKRCSNCGAILEGLETIKAAHKWDAGEVTKPATCTETGVKTYTCTVCKETEDRDIPVIEHAWDNGKVTKEATCTANGTKTYTCTVCEATKTEDIAKIDHVPVIDEAVEPTCTEAGKTEGSHCEICGEVLKKQETIDATGHTEVTDAAVPATCTEAGKTEGSHCEICGEVLKKQETIDATGHDFGEWETVTSPNCTASGSKKRVCKTCGYTEEKDIDAAGHVWNEDYTIDQKATCTTDGSKSIHCKNCDAVKDSETIKATGHTEVTDAAVAPTCTTDGKTEGLHCSVCNEVIKAQETIKATGHSFTNYVYNNDAKPGKDGTETAACDHQGCNATDTRTKAGTAKPTVTFNDIDETQYYAAPVQWAVEREITNGIDDGVFAPDMTCTRGQIVTFLWRASGRPEPTSTNNPFTDVPENEYYYKAVLWAVEQGITTGTSDTTFSPNQGCTRGQVATFLWRAAGKPSSSAGNQFSDVDTSEYYGTAVLWASEKGITNGMGDGTFAPNATCTRGQIVTFLYRAMA